MEKTPDTKPKINLKGIATGIVLAPVAVVWIGGMFVRQALDKAWLSVFGSD